MPQDTHTNLPHACNAYVVAKASGKPADVEAAMLQLLTAVNTATEGDFQSFLKHQQPDMNSVLAGKAFI